MRFIADASQSTGDARSRVVGSGRGLIQQDHPGKNTTHIDRGRSHWHGGSLRRAKRSSEEWREEEKAGTRRWLLIDPVRIVERVIL